MNRPSITLIAGYTSNRVLGLSGKIPWHCADDLRHFKHLTIGHPVIMGRRTWESLKETPLPGRMNIIVSSTLKDQEATVIHEAGLRTMIVFVDSLETALMLSYSKGAHSIETSFQPNIFIIGGAQLYNEALPYCNAAVLTVFDLILPGDTFFPKLDLEQWRETDAIYRCTDIVLNDKTVKNVGCRILTYQNKNPRIFETSCIKNQDIYPLEGDYVQIETV